MSFAADMVHVAAVEADVDQVVAANTGLSLFGYSVRGCAEASAAVALILVHGRTVAGGTAVAQIEIMGNTSQIKWFGDCGIACPEGISIGHIKGIFDIVILYKIVA